VVQLTGDDLTAAGPPICWEDRYDAGAINFSSTAIKARH
jgi:hypothetical protein